MANCAVCNTAAAFAHSQGNRYLCTCPRCGVFEVSSTAWDILTGRTRDALERSRLSHAIRSRTSQAEPLYLNREKLEELAKERLPNVAGQAHNLLQWIKEKVADDPFSTVQLLPENEMSSIVGAGSPESFRTLLTSMVGNGLVERRRGRTPDQVTAALISITRKGWDEMSKRDAATSISNVAPPPPTARARGRPDWLPRLKDETLREIMDEVYRGLDAGLRMLPLIGARTAFDRAMTEKLGFDPKGGFEAKLKLMKERGHLTAQNADHLRAVIDAGNAAAHRGWRPIPDDVSRVLDEVEHTLRELYFRADDTAALKAAVPPRP